MCMRRATCARLTQLWPYVHILLFENTQYMERGKVRSNALDCDRLGRFRRRCRARRFDRQSFAARLYSVRSGRSRGDLRRYCFRHDTFARPADCESIRLRFQTGFFNAKSRIEPRCRLPSAETHRPKPASQLGIGQRETPTTTQYDTTTPDSLQADLSASYRSRAAIDTRRSNSQALRPSWRLWKTLPYLLLAQAVPLKMP